MGDGSGWYWWLILGGGLVLSLIWFTLHSLSVDTNHTVYCYKVCYVRLYQGYDVCRFIYINIICHVIRAVRIKGIQCLRLQEYMVEPMNNTHERHP